MPVGGLRAPLVFLSQGTSTCPPSQPESVESPAGGWERKDGATFQAKLDAKNTLRTAAVIAQSLDAEKKTATN